MDYVLMVAIGCIALAGVFGGIWLAGGLDWSRGAFLWAALLSLLLAPLLGLIVGRILRASTNRPDVPWAIVWGAILEPALLLASVFFALAITGSRRPHPGHFFGKALAGTALASFLMLLTWFPALVSSWAIAGR
ncbi:hypothetical protein [Candidatus Amarobacter glycogenicus]|uniref:hypothetical protein n=1 Tax=Candidatus Amarobacter glycogenicus TaxID=3140699 RepID=UPI003136BD36|nr:hypothetical protein [Dehalococcoidia bacterium]